MHNARLLLFAIFAAGCLQTHAERMPRLKRSIHWADSMLTVRYLHSDIDTLYITRPPTMWTVKARFNISASRIHIKGMYDDVSFASKMDAKRKSTLSAAINYCGISVGLSINPAKLLGRYNDTEANIHSYGKRTGFDIVYQNAHNFKGWYESDVEERISLPADIMSLRAVTASAYYVFNHRRFSYPAALSQSYIQQRSCGSVLMAASYQGQLAKIHEAIDSKLRVHNIGVGVGYGYNYVPSHKWLIHLSALPTIIVYSHATTRVDDERTRLKYDFPEFIFTGRCAVVRQINRYFVGATVVYNLTHIGSSRHLQVDNSQMRARAVVGYRF